MAQARREWQERQGGWDPARLIFLDESGASTNLTRQRGRALRGQRVPGAHPHGHWKVTTMIASVRADGSTAAMAIVGATDTPVFRSYVEEVLGPTLRAGDVVVMDNLSPHKNEATLELIRSKGAEPRFLPPYSPDLNPIEMMWSKVKASLRATQARTLPRLQKAIAHALTQVTASDARSWFAACGYSSI